MLGQTVKEEKRGMQVSLENQGLRDPKVQLVLLANPVWKVLQVKVL